MPVLAIRSADLQLHLNCNLCKDDMSICRQNPTMSQKASACTSQVNCLYASGKAAHSRARMRPRRGTSQVASSHRRMPKL